MGQGTPAVRLGDVAIAVLAVSAASPGGTTGVSWLCMLGGGGAPGRLTMMP
jgi:hypothetical protein